MRYSSDFVDKTLGLGPDSGLDVWEEWQGETHCNHCARPITPGMAYQVSAVGPAFSENTRSLSGASQTICWRCVHLRKKPMLYSLGAAVITNEHVYPISKDVHKAWLFLTPPKPPFMVVHSSSTMQHLTWRTPVTLDERRIVLRFGPDLMYVNPARIKQAIAITENFSQQQGKYSRPLFLDRNAQDPGHGLLTRAARENLSAEDRQFLISLSRGELWALSYIMHSKQPVPEQPEPITSIILERLADTAKPRKK